MLSNIQHIRQGGPMDSILVLYNTLQAFLEVCPYCSDAANTKQLTRLHRHMIQKTSRICTCSVQIIDLGNNPRSILLLITSNPCSKVIAGLSNQDSVSRPTLTNGALTVFAPWNRSDMAEIELQQSCSGDLSDW